VAAVASFLAAVLTEIYPCGICSCHEINIETQRPGAEPVGSGPSRRWQRPHGVWAGR
jgi:hypothetical protein